MTNAPFKILGYSVEDWLDMASIWMHIKDDMSKTEEECQPKDLGELLQFWLSQERKTPNDCLYLGFTVSQARGEHDVKWCVDMVEKYIKETKVLLK